MKTMDNMIEKGDFIRDSSNLVRGIVLGEGTIGGRIPAYKIDTGGGREGLIIQDQAVLIVKEMRFCPFHPRREGTEKALLTDDGMVSYPEWVCRDCLETLESSALGLA